MRVAIAQIDPVVGDFAGNVSKIDAAYQLALRSRARLLVTPELAICGYPPHDLIERPEIFERTEKALADLARRTRGQSCSVAVGHIAVNPAPVGRAAQNVVSVLENGQVVFRQAKSLLPTYDVFDEARYFEPAREAHLFQLDGHSLAFAICEDLWVDDPSIGRRLYGTDPAEAYRRQGARVVISLSASPYEIGKSERREELHQAAARKLGATLLYVNQVGATDEILFDGGSFALRADGTCMGRLPFFSTCVGVLDTEGTWEQPGRESREDEPPPTIEVLSRALVTGIREYFSRSGFSKAVIGLSGGIDSALTATLAARALGPGNVLGVAMPSQFSSSHSLEDAELLARNLGIRLETRPIKFQFASISRELSDGRGDLAPVALENLQSRLRGIVLMTLSNHLGALVLTTGNKSELATGFCTLYGDMCGALAPIGDLTKTRVYELARYLNQAWGGPIPERSLTKAPSPELRPNQTDQDVLPPYGPLDQALELYIEGRHSIGEIESRLRNGKDPGDGWIRPLLARVEANEFKRRQAAPVLKVTSKAFGVGRRIPIAKHWDK